MEESRKRRFIPAVVAVVVACCQLVALWLSLEDERPRKQRRISYLSGEEWVKELLSSDGPQCHENLRMTPDCFMQLRDTLMQRGLLENTRAMTVDEQLAMFLHTLAHNVTNRVIANRFNHSGATVSRYFHKVLNAICKLYPDYVQVPDNSPTPLQIRTNTRFYPYFKDCIGAIDGTHVPAHVPFSLQAKYRNRHGQLSQNCLMACGFDMLFHYVLAGWEGSAADATVLFSALNRGDRLAVPDGPQRKDNFKWNPRAERVLMDTLLEMKLAGRKVEKNFNNACWEEALAKVKEKTGLEPTASNAKNKYKNWRTRYREVKQLLSMSGFGWDDTLKMVTAEDDVWDNLEQAKSKLAKYRRIAVKFYEEIHDLIADDIAEGEIALTGIERSQTNAPETEMDEENINESLGTQPHGLDDMDEPHQPQHSVNSPRRTSIPSRQTSTSRTSKKQKSKTSDEVKETLDRVANAVYALADQMNPHDNIIPKITAAVTSLASIPRHMKMAVINFLVRDHITAVTFMSLDDDMKLEWLEMNFNQGSSG